MSPRLHGFARAVLAGDQADTDPVDRFFHLDTPAAQGFDAAPLPHARETRGSVRARIDAPSPVAASVYDRFRMLPREIRT